MKRIVPLLLVVILTACSESPLLPEGALSSPTGTLTLTAIHHLSGDLTLAPNADGSKVLTNDLGFRITLTHASVGYRSLKLVSSGTDPECIGGNDVTIAVNGSDDLLGEDLAGTTLGAHTIPLASFCSYELAMGLHLEGTWSKEGGAETAFEAESEEEVEATGAFGHPLHFHEGETETAKAFGLSYDALFDGVDFEGTSVAETITANLAGAVEILSAH
jgi:hypothetical protein